MRHLSRLGLVLILLLLGASAFADGLLIPGPWIAPPTTTPLDLPYFTIKYHHVTMTVTDQVATTSVDQVFVNESGREQEATYIFPLPSGAVVQKFTLIADGQEVNAQLLTKEEAQRIYENIVRARRDPALLTYAGHDAYQAKIYPIPAGGSRRIQLSYSQVLPYDAGLVTYLYPLSTEKFSPRPLEEATFVGDIYSQQPIGSVYSPTHTISCNRLSDTHVRVSWEENNTRPDRDLLLYYTVAKDPVGLSLVTFKEPNKDGFFLLLAAPTMEQTGAQAMPKQVVFVMDVSGSMAGEKIKQVQDALTYCVNSLHPQDKFDIIAFNDQIQDFAGGLVPATQEQVQKAGQFIAGMEARGGTDIDTALTAALKYRQPGMPSYLVFLTDGQPTVGETDTEKIVAHIRTEIAAVRTPTRLFDWGVGYDVNVPFLDKLAYENNGLSTFVRPSENIETKVSSFFAKISQPVLADVQIDFGTAQVYDAYPRQLPDLFYGSQVEVFGRYKAASAGPATIRLTGTMGGGSKTFELPCDFPEVKAGCDYIASLWASRRIGYLLDAIRLNGPNKELIDEVVHLSLEYGILTEYTAFLAQEPATPPSYAGAIPVPYRAGGAAPSPQVVAGAVASSGMVAGAAGGMGGGYGGNAGPVSAPAPAPVQMAWSQNAQNMQQQTGLGATNTYVDSSGTVQRIANIQNVGQRGYIQRKGRWEDTRYQADMKIALQVQAYSEAYFQLSRAFPDLNQQMSVGDHVLVILNNQAVEVGPAGQTTLTDAELQALAAGKAPVG
jgi:Ca-activated chloride channel family protein